MMVKAALPGTNFRARAHPRSLTYRGGKKMPRREMLLDSLVTCSIATLTRKGIGVRET